jgi:hypothetical protein
MHGVMKSKVLWAIIQPDLDNFREFGEVNLRFVLKERFDNASQLLPFYKRLKGFTVTLEDLPLTMLGKLNRYEIKKIYEPRVIAGKEGALPVSGELSAEDLLLIGSVIGKTILRCLRSKVVLKGRLSLRIL